MSYKKGDVVKIVSDNENYDEFFGHDIPLIVTHVARDKDEHPGYDDDVGQYLYDLKTESGKVVPFSLYDYELEPSSRSDRLKAEWISIDTKKVMKESMRNFMSFLIAHKVDFVGYQSGSGNKLYMKITKTKSTPSDFNKQISKWSYYDGSILFLKSAPDVSDYDILKEFTFTNSD